MIWFIFRVVVVPFVIALISLGIVKLFSHKFTRLKKVSALAYGVNTLFVSQVLFVLIALFLIVWSDGYIFYAAGIIVFINYFLAAFSFFLGFFIQRTLVIRESIVVEKSGILMILRLVLASAVLSMSFFMYGGMFIASDIVSQIALITGSPILVNTLGNQIDQDTKNRVYTKHAARTRNVSVCDNMSNEDIYIKNACYKQVDPMYKDSQESCDLYPKFVNSPTATFSYAHNDQAKCAINNLAIEQYKSKTLDCSVFLEKFVQNREFNLIKEKCAALEELQEVVLTGDPLNCDKYEGDDKDNQEVRAVCYSEYVGTLEHERFCEYVEDEREFTGSKHGRMYYVLEDAAELAKCPEKYKGQYIGIDIQHPLGIVDWGF